MKYPSLLDEIGNTPLIKLDLQSILKYSKCNYTNSEYEKSLQHTFLAKLEYLNPGGSIKDRSALFMVEDAEKTGMLRPGGTIVEASSGNQGIALALIGAIKGYQVIITVPNRTSVEKIATLQAYGAKVYVCPDTDSLEDPEGYHNKAEELAKKIEGSFMPNQYYNVKNPQAHYATTGPEIWNQTGGTITHCFMGMGSCGTVTGIGRYLKEQNKNIKIIGVDIATSKLSCPENPKKYRSEGLGVDVVTDTLDLSVIDEVVPITDNDAFSMTRNLAKSGYLVGISSGAVMHVMLNYLHKIPKDSVIVVIFADSGRAYLNKVFNF